MANSEGRKGGMNFHPRQLQRVWKPKDEYAEGIRRDSGQVPESQKSKNGQGDEFEGR
jgi:hypothetical protein